MTRTSFAVALLAASLSLAVRPSRAQMGESPGANLDGFTVSGKGAVGARPNRVEIELEISAASEMSSDVIVKYRDAKKRLQEAFATLKLANVAIEERALGVDQKGQVFNPYYMDSAPARKGKVEVQLSRKLVASCSGIREMDEEALLQMVARLLDVAQDSGGKVGGGGEYNPYYGRVMGGGGGGLVKFILDDFDALQEKAYEAAIADARTRATRLAKLSGVTLGPVLGVREVFVSGEKAKTSMPYYYEMMMGSDDEMPRKQVESAKFHEIPVRVELQVRFAVAPAAPRRDGGQ